MKHLINEIFYKYRMFILTIIAFVSIVMITYLILIPRIKNIFEKRQIVDQDKAMLTTLINKRKLLDSMAGGDNLKLFEDAQKALPNEKDAAGILLALDNLVAQTQFSIYSINLNPGMISSKSAEKTGDKAGEPNDTINVKNKGANFMPIKIAGGGQTANFLNFLKKLTQILPLFDIYQISANYEVGNTDNLKADFSLNAYYLIPIKEIGSLESNLPELLPKEKSALTNLTNFPYFGDIAEENTVNLPVGKSDLFTP